MVVRLWRRRIADQRLGRAWSDLDVLFPSPGELPESTPDDRADLVASVAWLDATLAGWHSQRWPEGAVEEVLAQLADLLDEFAGVVSGDERRVLQALGDAVVECAAAARGTARS